MLHLTQHALTPVTLKYVGKAGKLKYQCDLMSEGGRKRGDAIRHQYQGAATALVHSDLSRDDQSIKILIIII